MVITDNFTRLKRMFPYSLLYRNISYDFSKFLLINMEYLPELSAVEEVFQLSSV